MKYKEMNIDEMKQVKSTWQIHLKIYCRRLKHIKCIEETKENRWELKQLEVCYNYCIETIKKIISIYSELINLGESCELSEDYFLKRIKEVQRLHSELIIELNKKRNKDLHKQYGYDCHTKKANLNI